ncbi:replication factor C subunit 1 [Leguminivora glycinivorella]|uniref:replication factor C subunit 1 n=1 Tax=Leguminivora glycinivorella TaxID=1035111 RepID=UPI00200C5F5B|nr:replication factor C subunit 1 [Leguminivora glycinivorella]
MSKDIRSFFKPQKPKKAKTEEDVDVIPESPDVAIKIKKRENRKKRVLSDSDEEIFSTKKKKSNEEPKHKTLPKKELKEVKAADIFGSDPIKRTEPSVQSVQKKTETGIHSDDDFDKSLLELDSTEDLDLNNVKKEPTSVKSKNSKSHKSPTKAETNSDINKKKTPEVNSINGNGNLSAEDHESETGSSKAKKRHLDLTSENTRESKQNKIGKSKQDVNKSKDSNSRNENTFTNDKDNFEATDSELDSSQVKSKRKLDQSLNESVLTDEERYERKRHSAALYQKYLNRSGPKHLGAKTIPEGTPNCLKDCAFLLTGVLDSFERDEVAEAITKLGGTIKNSISKKVTHVLAGEDAGPAKLAKAQDLGIKIINENEFLELIVTLSKGDKTEKTRIKDEIKKEKHSIPKSNKEKHHTENKKNQKSDTSEKSVKVKTSSKDKDIKSEIVDVKVKIETKKDQTKSTDTESKSKLSVNTTESKIKVNSTKDSQDSSSTKPAMVQSAMWVEKYKPQSLKQIIGQHGEASNVKKLCNWLTKWYVNRKAKLPKPSPWAKNDDGGYYKAALLSGPPGVGKTTTVTLVCKELGFDMVEFNASDTRNKTLIKEQIGELLTTTSLSGYAKGMTGKQAVSKKHVLVMDEVDGMAGNEDRGGLQELISLIKAASVPIICMCNDRNSQKMRSLVNYCYDLRFNRPRVDQIKAAMMSVCCKEGIKVPGEALSQLIVAANQDVRQTLNLLSMWAVDRDRADADRLARDASQTKKDIKLGPWEAIRKVFSAEEHKSMSIHDKSDLFFYDYSLAPLFVQENYLQVAPHCPKHEVLERLSRAADSISVGDLVEARIRGSQAWSLLPIQAMYSSVIPGHAMAGHVTGQIQFPGWLGKNSRKNKMHRLCQEIHAHTRLRTSGSKSSIFLDYCTHLRDAIVTPLVRDKADGIAQSLEVLEAYHLLRDDLDSLTEMSLWPGQRNPMILIDSKVKAAMTRTYNKKAMALPYAPGAVRRARAADADADGAPADDDADADADADQQDDSDPENDLLIKKKRPMKKPEVKKMKLVPVKTSLVRVKARERRSSSL